MNKLFKTTYLRQNFSTGTFSRRLSFFPPLMFPVLLLLFLTGAGIQADTEPIALKAEALPFIPKEFYIAGVTDARHNKKAVAWLIPVAKSTAQAAETVPVDLKGGAINAIEHFIKQSLPANSELRPVVIKLTECRVTEKILDDKSVEGTVVVSMDFSIAGEEENKYLTDYKGSTRYIRSSAQHTIVEQALRQSLAGSLRYLNNWMNQEAPHNIKLAKGLKISFTDFTQSTGDDTVFYDPSRPITWDDFLGRPGKSNFEASIFPNFGYKNNSRVSDGYLNLDITFRVYMLKNISWVKGGTRDAYALNHEQRHFDIVKIITERFKQKILMKGLSMEDYDGELGYLYLETYREMNKLQEQYDRETNHGINSAAQESWNKKISLELKSYGIQTH